MAVDLRVDSAEPLTVVRELVGDHVAAVALPFVV